MEVAASLKHTLGTSHKRNRTQELLLNKETKGLEAKK